jgi:hypothetical protein
MLETAMAQEISLKGRIPGGASLGFFSIVIPMENDRYIPLTLVKYTINGELQKYGLRFDLDKRSFADHFLENPDQENVLRAAVPKLIEIATEAIKRHRYQILAKEFGKD